jgi:hypothetical protein
VRVGAFIERVASSLVAKAVGWVLTVLAVFVLAALGLDKDKQWYKNQWQVHWKTVTLVVLLLVITVIAIALIEKFAKIAYRLRVSFWSGIVRVYPVQRYGDPESAVRVEERKLAEKAIQDAVRDAKVVRLLLVSGWRHIGCDPHQGLLWNSLRGRNSIVDLEVCERRV